MLYFPKMADHGRSWFVGTIFIISLFTYALAIYIGTVLEFLKNFFKYPPPKPGGEAKRKKKIGHEVPPNLWKGLGDGYKWMKKNWLDGDWREHEKVEVKTSRQKTTNELARAERGEVKFGSGSSTESPDPQQPVVTTQPVVTETLV